METISIVGGGTAGLVTALILKKRFQDKDISIIKSDKIGIIGVGEGTTEHWMVFMKHCDISTFELIKETDATIKMGVMFEDWTPKKYFHAIQEEYHKIKFGQYLACFGEKIKEDQLTTCLRLHENNECYSDDMDAGCRIPQQFHFNTFKLNQYLLKLCKERGISIIEDEIKEVEIDNNTITKLIGEKSSYQSDFFIDSTGFKRKLISKLGAKWQPYDKHLKMNEAIAFQTEDTDNYNIYTLSKAMKYGWMWRIPVWGRWGNGYIFDNHYIDKDQAKKEVEEVLGREIEIARNVKFQAGKLDKAWIGNCCAVGLSANFVEPLEATSIGTSIEQAFLLSHYLTNYKQNMIDDYNEKLDRIMDNLRDFVFLHYMVDRNDTQFWKDIKDIEIPETLKTNLEKWKYRLPINEDFMTTRYLLFKEENWTSVLHGIDFYKDNQYVIDEYESYPISKRQYVKDQLDSMNTVYNNALKIPHKSFISNIRTKNVHFWPKYQYL